MVHEREVALRRLKQEYENQAREKDKLSKEVQMLRITKEDSNRRVHDELSRVTYEKNSLEKTVADLR